MKLATVICWYGRYHNLPDQKYGVYPSCIDVYFWHSKRVSKGHFADSKFVEIIAKPSINETIENLPLPRRQLFKFLLWAAFKGGSAHA